MTLLFGTAALGGAQIVASSTLTSGSLGTGGSFVSADLTVGNNGQISSTSNVSAPAEDWCRPTGAAGLFEVEFHVNSGATPTGAAMDTYLACSTSRTVTIETDAVEAVSSEVRIRWRRAGTTDVLKECTLSMNATTFA